MTKELEEIKGRLQILENKLNIHLNDKQGHEQKIGGEGGEYDLWNTWLVLQAEILFS